jgi:heptosyltransferase-3
MAYVGMDTLNMHIAASQNKRIFVISGPTNLKMWSPWSNQLKRSASLDMPIQTYGDITIFQANMKCVACGKAGCDDSGISKCLNNISPKIVFEEVKEWYKYVGL